MVGISAPHEEASAELRALRRDQMIDHIRRRNPGATPDFLGRFADDALRLYLRHLACADQPRGSVWTRPGDTVGILYREASE